MCSKQRILVLAIGLLFCGMNAPADGQSAASPVDSLIGAMTLDEKLTLLHGAQDPSEQAGAGYVPGIERLGIPELRLADGPAGIRTAEPATALPAPVALAASFDPELARQFGEVIGEEGRARNQDVLLSPMVNIVRVPQAGRNFETLGEDPLLAGRMVAEEIRGIESRGLIATVKHYVANNFENNRMNVSADVGERALHEIYLPGFEAAVDAGVGAVMCAYNRVNGTYACDNSTILTGILRDRFGFTGWVMSDWFAGHSLGALGAGLDQEMPGLNFPGVPQPVLFGDSLKAAVESGRISEREVDASVRRILQQMDRMDLLGGSVPPRPEIDPEAGAEVARAVAESGAVLLRNERNTLPLTENDWASLAVIGPTAQRPLYGGGGSSHVQPFQLEHPLEALRRRAGADASIRYAEGIDLDGATVPTSALTPADAPDAQGLRRTGDNDTDQVDPEVDFTGDDALPSGSSWTWTGTLTAPATGSYDLKLQTAGGGGTLSLDGEQLVSTGGFFSDASLIPTDAGLNNATATLDLDAGETYEITISVQGGGGGFMGPPSDAPLQVRLAWVTPERRQSFRAEAAEAAREAEAAVVFAYNEGTEGTDRSSLALPGTQDALVEAVTSANERTTVVLNTGDPVLMPWLTDTGAVLQMWYPGQEGADATAALLTGAANPGGKLPVTFPRRVEDAPTHPEERYPGIDGHANYSEGVFVGYRWYDEQDIDPLFPFGHGLSYTSFEYTNLEVEPSGDGYDVRFRVRNTGSTAGAAVPQIYLGAPADPPVPMAPRQLVGFERVELAPDEEETITVHITPRQLSYWSTDQNEWAVATGTRSVAVGASSRDLKLTGKLNADQ